MILVDKEEVEKEREEMEKLVTNLKRNLQVLICFIFTLFRHNSNTLYSKFMLFRLAVLQDAS